MSDAGIPDSSNTSSALANNLELVTRRRFQSLNLITTNDPRPEELIENQTSFNIHLIGPPCSGKTSVVKSAVSTTGQGHSHATLIEKHIVRMTRKNEHGLPASPSLLLNITECGGNYICGPEYRQEISKTKVDCFALTCNETDRSQFEQVSDFKRQFIDTCKNVPSMLLVTQGAKNVSNKISKEEFEAMRQELGFQKVVYCDHRDCKECKRALYATGKIARVMSELNEEKSQCFTE